ncbi:hypothetical protein CLV59_101164 [Chitinophaga dinghuensis]|uniref:Uncharacterized protein n=1 Tax=Chitinophaga dinghuensis TaxID=1539050 RepID=A0A327WI40_9BACT|nr:hypothetical protein [Chitinophaga dinghuensis]RAJ87414.1 hypothetical protein CLV59_101164 [Chitinophaga dinghuensis]
MKILQQDNNTLILHNNNLTARVVLLTLIVTGIGMLLLFLIKGIEPLLWLGGIISLGAGIGYLFIDTTVLSMDKQQQQAGLVKSSLLKKVNKEFSFGEIDSFILKVVATRAGLDEDDQPYGSNESVYIRLVEKNGKQINLFVGDNREIMQRNLDLIKRYFARA